MLTARSDQNGFTPPLRAGFTLIELLVASALAFTVAIGISTMEGSRMQMEEEIIARSGLASDQGQVALATVELSERIATADWGDLGGGALRLRIPTKCPTMTAACLDNPSNYQWDQYRLSGGTLWLHTDTGAGCGGGRVIARNVLFTVSFNGTGNAIDYAVLWDNGLAGSRHRTHEFRGHVASRLRAAPGGSLAPAPGLPPVC